jgi:hypothetical protein
MAVEYQRGISVSSAVMSFEHEGLAFNLLDTPGHQDFSEDTYRNCRGYGRKAALVRLRENIPPLLRIKVAGGHSAERSRAGKYGKKRSRWIHLPSRLRRPF